MHGIIFEFIGVEMEIVFAHNAQEFFELLLEPYEHPYDWARECLRGDCNLFYPQFGLGEYTYDGMTPMRYSRTKGL